MEVQSGFPRTASIAVISSSITSEAGAHTIQYATAIVWLGTEQKKEIQEIPAKPLQRRHMARIIFKIGNQGAYSW